VNPTDTAYRRALLYLNAAGHDTCNDTRSRLRGLLNDGRHDLRLAHLLPQVQAQLCDQQHQNPTRPPQLVRGKMGYGVD